MQVIKELIQSDTCPGESKVKRGVYFDAANNEYFWLTLSRSGYCKKLSTALRKAGF